MALGVGVLVVLVLLSDTQQLLQTAANVRPVALVFPLLLSALSYAAMARSYQEIGRAHV